MRRLGHMSRKVAGQGAVSPCLRRRGDAGFSLFEMLAALVVLALLTATVATGTNVATQLYRKSMFSSQAETLSSQIDTALADPFRFMKASTDETSGVTTYTIVYQDNSVDGTIVDSNPQLIAKDGCLYLRGTVTDNSTTPATSSVKDIKILNAGAYGNCAVTVDDFQIKHDGTDVVYIKYTITSTQDSSLSKQYEMSFGYDPDNGVSKVLPTS